MSDSIAVSAEYRELLDSKKQTIAAGRLRAARAVNNVMIETYWAIGRDIIARQQEQRWGASRPRPARASATRSPTPKRPWVAGRAAAAALVVLLQARPDGLSWAEITAELIEAGSAARVWERHAPPTLISLPGEISPASAVTDIEAWRTAGYRLVSVLDEDYPSGLRGVHQAPLAIFTQGALLADDPAVSVVGSREAPPAGLAMAVEIARALIARKMTVISGLARGIDTAAHRAALDAGGRTVAVIATGLGKTYPPENRALQREIAHRGLVLSQFWPDAPPQKPTFLMRNATMSGYGLATVVVEAGETSGARAQARMAVEHGRQVILTDQVVTKNQWAQALVGRPGVHVAGSVAAVTDVVDQVVAMWDELRRLVTP